MLEAMGIKLELIKFGENKAEGNNLGPLTDSARAHMQEMVDTYGKAFERAVARGRGITQGDGAQQLRPGTRIRRGARPSGLAWLTASARSIRRPLDAGTALDLSTRAPGAVCCHAPPAPHGGC